MTTDAELDRFMTDKNFLGDHIFVKEPPRRSWQFQRFANGEVQWCPYGFIFSYHPGCFSLWGDLSNLQINHYSAIDENLEGSLHWLAFSGSDYLLSKSTAKTVFEPAQTAKSIIDEIQEMPESERAAAFIDLADYIWTPKFTPENYGSAEEFHEQLLDDLESHINESDRDAYELLSGAFDDWCDPHLSIVYDYEKGTTERLAAMKFAAREILVREFGRDPKTPDVSIERAA